MINFCVKQFSQERPLTALALIVHANFRKINFRSRHRLRKYFYNENFQIYGNCLFHAILDHEDSDAVEFSLLLSHIHCCFLQRIDMERATREAMDPNLRHKPRLLSEEELPSWLLKDEDEVGNHYTWNFFSMYNQVSHCSKSQCKDKKMTEKK